MEQPTGCSPAQPRADEHEALCCLPDHPGLATGTSWREWNSPFEAEQDARRMFQRTLAHWAMDVLALRQRGLDVPGGRRRRRRTVAGAMGG